MQASQTATSRKLRAAQENQHNATPLEENEDPQLYCSCAMLCFRKTPPHIQSPACKLGFQALQVLEKSQQLLEARNKDGMNLLDEVERLESIKQLEK